MKRVFFAVLCLFILFLHSGCSPVISTGKKFDIEQVPRIQDGKTTKEEILAMFGQPNNKTISGSTEMWMYMYTETPRVRTFKESMNIYLGRSMEIKSPKMQSLYVTFRGNVVESHSVNVSGEE